MAIQAPVGFKESLGLMRTGLGLILQLTPTVGISRVVEAQLFFHFPEYFLTSRGGGPRLWFAVLLLVRGV